MTSPAWRFSAVKSSNSFGKSRSGMMLKLRSNGGVEVQLMSKLKSNNAKPGSARPGSNFHEPSLVPHTSSRLAWR